jgi:hypothetical protein
MSTILQFLYDLVNWQYFGILAIIWVVADLVWVGKWKSLMFRIGILIIKPWIFKKDKNPEIPPLYPREFLEQLALNSRRNNDKTNAETEDGLSGVGPFTKWLNALREQVFDFENPIRPLGYVLALAFFIFFLLADAIIVAATLVLLGVISPDLPPILQRLELAILGGALLSAVVGVWMLVELSGKGELINVEQMATGQKRILRAFAALATLFAMAVLIALAFQRLILLGTLESSPTTEIILSFILYGLLAINNTFGAALTFSPAASGFVVVLYLAFVIFVGLLPILAFLADVIWRFVYIAVDIVIWVLFTPIIAIPYGFGKMFGLIDNSDEKESKNKKSESDI